MGAAGLGGSVAVVKHTDARAGDVTVGSGAARLGESDALAVALGVSAQRACA